MSLNRFSKLVLASVVALTLGAMAPLAHAGGNDATQQQTSTGKNGGNVPNKNKTNTNNPTSFTNNHNSKNRNHNNNNNRSNHWNTNRVNMNNGRNINGL